MFIDVSITLAVAGAIRNSSDGIFLCHVVPGFREAWEYISPDSGTLSSYVDKNWTIKQSLEDVNLLRVHLLLCIDYRIVSPDHCFKTVLDHHIEGWLVKESFLG